MVSAELCCAWLRAEYSDPVLHHEPILDLQGSSDVYVGSTSVYARLMRSRMNIVYHIID